MESNGIPIKAKVYFVKEEGTSIKCTVNVSIGDLLHINSYKVTTTTNNPGKLNVYPPSYHHIKSNEWRPYIETPNRTNNPVQKAIFKAGISAYKRYEDTHQLHQYGETYVVTWDELNQFDPRDTKQDSVVEDIPDDFDMKKALEDIPF